MYQDDMQDDGDGYRGRHPDPKVMVQSSKEGDPCAPTRKKVTRQQDQEQQQEQPPPSQHQLILEMEEDYDDGDEPTGKAYDHTELFREQPTTQRQHRQYNETAPEQQQHQEQQQQQQSPTSARRSYMRRLSSGLEDRQIPKEYDPPPQSRQQQHHYSNRSRSRSRSLSPGGRPRERSRSRSISPGGGRRYRTATSNATTISTMSRGTVKDSSGSSGDNNIDEDYHLMPLEMDGSNNNITATTGGDENNSNSGSSKKKLSRRQKRKIKDADERYEAQIAFSLQMAFSFFCVLVVIVIVMAGALSKQGYYVIVFACLAVLLSLAVGLCWFVSHVLNEDDTLSNVNQKHMPVWYQTATKIVRQELADIRGDWKAMCNNMYLLEDGSAGNGDDNDDEEEPEDDKDNFKDEIEVPSEKNKKRRGKSFLFKMVVKPVAALANFRRNRKEKKRSKKASHSAPFPSTV